MYIRLTYPAPPDTHVLISPRSASNIPSPYFLASSSLARNIALFTSSSECVMRLFGVKLGSLTMRSKSPSSTLQMYKSSVEVVQIDVECKSSNYEEKWMWVLNTICAEKRRGTISVETVGKELLTCMSRPNSRTEAWVDGNLSSKATRMGPTVVHGWIYGWVLARLVGTKYRVGTLGAEWVSHCHFPLYLTTTDSHSHFCVNLLA